MTIQNKQELINLLNRNNPWWAGRELHAEKYHRRDFHILKRIIRETKDIIAITGPRQVGKTVLVKQLIKFLLNAAVIPKQIIYLTADDYAFLPVSRNPIQDSIEVYQEAILGMQIQDVNGDVYLFIDEIQKIPKWNDVLKPLIDRYKGKIRIVITGSSSLDIYAGSHESLAGRIRFQLVLPLKFIDFIGIRKSKQNIEIEELNILSRNLRALFKKALETKDASVFTSVLLQNYAALDKEKPEIISFLNEYLIKGGYPEIVLTDKLEEAGAKLRTTLDLVVASDIQRLFEVRGTFQMKQLLRILSGQITKYLNVEQARTLIGVDEATVKRYLSHLQKVFLIHLSEEYSRNILKKSRRQRKLYFQDLGLRNILADKFYKQALQTDAGELAEMAAFEHALRLKFNLDPASSPILNYWADKYRTKEVDIVLEHKGVAYPIEIKYREQLRDVDFKGINGFVQEYKPPFSIMVTKDIINFRDNIIFIPLWMFLLLA